MPSYKKHGVSGLYIPGTPLVIGHEKKPAAGGGGGSQVTFTLLASGNVSLPGGGATWDVPSFTTPNADEVVYFCFANAFSGEAGDDVLSLAGAGLGTWARVAEHHYAGNRRAISVFRAQGSSPSSATLTMTEAATPWWNGYTGQYAMIQAANADTTGTQGSGATGTPTEADASSTSLTCTITGSPGANDATLAVCMADDDASSIVEPTDSSWVEQYDAQSGDIISSYCTDEAADLTPTWTWTGTGTAAAIGFVVNAA